MPKEEEMQPFLSSGCFSTPRLHEEVATVSHDPVFSQTAEGKVEESCGYAVPRPGFESWLCYYWQQELGKISYSLSEPRFPITQVGIIKSIESGLEKT